MLFRSYQDLYFSPIEWSEIIQQARQTKDIWIDVFDAYGVQIITSNLASIHGIKFQSSVLYNREVLDSLSQLNLSDKRIILNIAAQEIDAIQERIETIVQLLAPKEVLLEIGFQAYPTELSDSGLSKIETIKSKFKHRIVFADHIEGKHPDSSYLPIMAWLLGAEVLEKHVMLADRETKYDHFSSQVPADFLAFTESLDRYCQAMQAPFINQREREYLEKTIMIPVLKSARKQGDLVSCDTDLFYRRSGKPGFSMNEIQALQNNGWMLAHDKQAFDTLEKADFKKAKEGIIVACRMKSSRLKEKALRKIGPYTSVEFCLRNALTFTGIDQVILATSTEPQDAILKDYTLNQKVSYFEGDPEDVMQRYIDVCDAHELDVVVRVTADMPYIDDDICSFLMQAHFQSGADYTVGREAAIGVNLEIFNTACLKRIKSYFPSADLSEYMTWYFQNNPEYVRINLVDLPEIYKRTYRLTLDYEEDLALFNAIHEALGPKDYSLKAVISYLDEHPEIAKMNSHLSLKYKTDQSLIDLLNEKTKIRP